MILQILNQALAPPTLQLLYQLLQQIKFLQQLQQQQLYFTQHGGKPGSPPLQLSVQITQAKQHIVNLQNQIAAQQALFLKQVCLLIFIANSFCLMIYIFSKWDAYNGQCIIFFKRVMDFQRWLWLRSMCVHHHSKNEIRKQLLFFSCSDSSQ